MFADPWSIFWCLIRFLWEHVFDACRSLWIRLQQQNSRSIDSNSALLFESSLPVTWSSQRRIVDSPCPSSAFNYPLNQPGFRGYHFFSELSYNNAGIGPVTSEQLVSCFTIANHCSLLRYRSVYRGLLLSVAWSKEVRKLRNKKWKWKTLCSPRILEQRRGQKLTRVGQDRRN